jgi:UDP-N-acetyl-D-mannosaminuronate dehydrogenase
LAVTEGDAAALTVRHQFERYTHEGFLGLGKLGLPCALAIDMKSHEVMGYDINPNILQKQFVP